VVPVVVLVMVSVLPCEVPAPYPAPPGVFISGVVIMLSVV
jgi:hypothetical protein